MKKALTLFLVFTVTASLLCVFAPTSFGQNYGLTEDLRINSYKHYTSPNSGAFIIIGEVQNVGTQYFHSARIRAAIYNASGEFLAEPVYSYTYADQLAPNETAAFYMVFTAAQSVTGDLSWVENGIGNIEFYCYGSADDTPQASGLNVVADTGSITGNGNYSVTGMVLNRGSGYPERSFVVGTFYDASGSVVAIGISNYLDRYLAPNNATSFIVGLFDAPAGIGNQIAGYSLRVVAENIVTEPPTPAPSITASPAATSGASTNPATSNAPSNNDNSGSSNTLYIALAAVGIVVAIVVLVLLLKRH